MKSVLKYQIWFFVVLVFPGLTGASKTELEAVDVEVVVKGYSTINEWKMISKEATGRLNLDKENGGLRGLRLQLPVKSLKSGTSAMERDAYRALKAEEFPEIFFSLSEIQTRETTGLITRFEAVGELTLAGVKRIVPVNATSQNMDEKLVIKGNTQIKLSNFEVTPPSAMFGLIKSGDEVSVEFQMVF
ncbi:MAG: YceI family protein [Bacteroidia bacterium]